MNESKHRPNGDYRYHASKSARPGPDDRRWQNASLTKTTDYFDKASGRNQYRQTRGHQHGNQTDASAIQNEEFGTVFSGQESDMPQPKRGWNKQYSPGPQASGFAKDSSRGSRSDGNKEVHSMAKYVVKKREEAGPSGTGTQQQQQQFHRSKEESPVAQQQATPGSEPVAAAAPGGGEADWPSLQPPQRASRPARGAVTTAVAAVAATVAAASPTRLAHLQESPLPPTPLTLVTPGGRFADEAQRQEFQDFLEPGNTNFTVVGVLGLHSSGKSSLLNALLLGRLPGHEEPPVSDREFAVETLDSLLENAHRTRGVQLQTTPERLFLLDCEALLALPSAEALIQAAASERRGGGAGQPDFITVETGATMQGIQLSAFLMSACHLLLVIADGWPDPDLLRLLLAADMLRPAVLDETGFQPRVVFVLNRTPAGAGPAPGRLCDLLAGVFEGAAFRLDASSVFCLPLTEEGSLDAAVEYTEELERLRKLILTAPRHHMLRQDLFNERVWLDFAAEVWENIEKSVMLAEYHKLIG